MPAFYKKKWFWVATIAVLLVGGMVFVKSRSSKAPEISTTTVKKIDLVQSVEETGSVTVANDISYGFEVGGKVVSLNKKVGDLVQHDDLIASLEGTAELQALRQAQAALASANAALTLKQVGASPEEIQESEAAVTRAKASVTQAEADAERTRIQGDSKVAAASSAVETAQNDLNVVKETGTSQIVVNAYADAFNTVKSTATTLRDALTNADNILGIDNVLANDQFEKSLGASNLRSLQKANQMYPIAKETARQAEAAIIALRTPNDYAAIDNAITLANNALDDAQELLLDVNTVLIATPPVGGVTQTTLDTLKTSIVTAQSSVSTAITNLTKTTQAISSAKNSLSSYQIIYDQAVKDLETAKQERDIQNRVAESAVDIQRAALQQTEASHARLIAPPRTVDLGTLQAEVLRQQASVAAAQKQYDKTKLRALTDGVLSTLDVRIGENVTANQPIVKIIAGSEQIDVDISESDIAKVAMNDTVQLTLDAFGDDVSFTGHVISIDPAQTEISGVIYYKVTVGLDSTNNQDVKPGMTANVRIITDTRPQVLVVPQRAIIEKDGQKIVRIVTDKAKGAYREQPVTTGIRGDDGQVEITTGVSEGDDIVTFIKETSARAS